MHAYRRINVTSLQNMDQNSKEQITKTSQVSHVTWTALTNNFQIATNFSNQLLLELLIRIQKGCSWPLLKMFTTKRLVSPKGH